MKECWEQLKEKGRERGSWGQGAECTLRGQQAFGVALVSHTIISLWKQLLAAANGVRRNSALVQF